MHVSAAFNGRDYWHTYIGDVPENLNSFIMNLTSKGFIRVHTLTRPSIGSSVQPADTLLFDVINT